MYINKTQSEIVFDLLDAESERLAHNENRLSFIATREELVEMMEKIAPTLENDGWTVARLSIVEMHRKALENDKAERKAEREKKRLTLLNQLA